MSEKETDRQRQTDKQTETAKDTERDRERRKSADPDRVHSRGLEHILNRICVLVTKSEPINTYFKIQYRVTSQVNAFHSTTYSVSYLSTAFFYK